MPHSAEAILRDFEQAKQDRRNFDKMWQDIADLVLPAREFTQNRRPGEERRLAIYDETAPQAAEDSASGLHGMLTNPGIKWVSISHVDPLIDENEEAREWLMDSRNRMLRLFANPTMGFNTQIYECYLDLVTFGTTFVTMMADKFAPLSFRTRALSDMYARTDEDDNAINFYRSFMMTNQQALDRWGNRVSEEVKRQPEDKLNEKREYIQAVFPRNDRMIGRANSINKPWASVVIDVNAKHISHEGGFDQNPFILARFSKASGEVYGRGPAVKMLPAIRMVNAMSQTQIAASEKAVDPPLLVKENAVIGPVRTRPASIIWTKAGVQDPVDPLTTARPDFGETLLVSRQEAIKRGFFLDAIGALPLLDRMTAREVDERTRQRMQMLSPALSRITEELLTPIVVRTFSAMLDRDMFAPIPEILQQGSLEVSFVSPLALSQRSSDINNILQWQSANAGLIEGSPNGMDNIDIDKVIRHTGSLLNVPPQLIRNEGEVENMRDQRQQQQEAAEAGKQIQDLSRTAQAGDTLLKLSGAG